MRRSHDGMNHKSPSFVASNVLPERNYWSNLVEFSIFFLLFGYFFFSFFKLGVAGYNKMKFVEWLK